MVKISEWGKSPALRLPRALMLEKGLSIGQSVEIESVEGGFFVRPSRPSYTLSELAARMKSDNRPEIVSWGPPVGNEAL